MVYFNKIRVDKPVIISRNTTGAAGNTAPKVTVVPVGQRQYYNRFWKGKTNFQKINCRT